MSLEKAGRFDAGEWCPKAYRFCSLLCGELNKGKAHGRVGVSAHAAVHHLPAPLEEYRQLLLCHLHGHSLQININACILKCHLAAGNSRSVHRLV